MENNCGKTKYYLVMEALKQEIMSGKRKAGEKIPSENQLKEKYQVSRYTIRKALSILEQEGYIEAEHGRGTFVRQRRYHDRNSMNIAVIITYLSDYIFPRVIQGIDNILTANGYSIILKNTGNSRYKEAQFLEEILSKDIDGLIIEPSKSQIYCRHIELYQKLDFFQIPYVFIQGYYNQMPEKPHVLMDDCQGGYLLTRYLLNLGHRYIVGVFKADDSQGKERHKGYVKALQEAGFLYNPDMVIWFHTEDRLVKPAGVLKHMLDCSIPIDGIICYNDQIALEVIRSLKEKNLNIPKDISVTGYDNSFIAEKGEIKLTTIAHPQEQLGAAAAELLIEKIKGISEKESKVNCLLKPELIIRESCIKREYH